MKKKWSGDGTYYLPARQIEPYRLWFEFLKLAHQDPEIEIDYKHYAEWDDFYNQPFNEWWSGERWRNLFAVDAGVRVLEDFQNARIDGDAIYVRLPLYADPKETVRDVAQLLEQHGATTRLDLVGQGKFALSQEYEKAFLKYLDRANLNLRLYRLWLKYGEYDKVRRVKRAAADFYKWAKQRDDLIKSKNYKYNRPLIPFAVSMYAQDVINKEVPSDNDRRAFMRYLQKGKNLAKNAAAGVFPGKY